MPERCDAVVIGAGVVGLAAARALALAGREVLVIDRADGIGTEISSRNSEVIHAGIYYPTGSLKAQLCVRGKALLYDHCERHAVPHRRIGKVIVATVPEQVEVLRGYQHQARVNGAGELKWLSQAEVERLEPAVRCRGGLFSPTTGIIESHAFMLSLQADLERHGGVVALLTEVTGLRQDGDRVLVRCGDFALSAALLVNAAGLEAPRLASALGGAWRPHFAKGHYYALSGPSPFSHLIYPVAEAGGLGVHVTLDLAGQARFGPDVLWTDAPSYHFDASALPRFICAIRRYYPDLDPARLHPSYTGVRPKLAPEGAPNADFVIEGPAEHGVAGLINLLGIESPGLTAALAIAERVAQLAAAGRR